MRGNDKAAAGVDDRTVREYDGTELAEAADVNVRSQRLGLTRTRRNQHAGDHLPRGFDADDLNETAACQNRSAVGRRRSGDGDVAADDG